MKNNKIVLIVSIVSILLVIATCFAYFSAVVVNTNNEKLSTRAGTISLKFDDNDNAVCGRLNLGESITKKFTLENTGTIDAYAKIS